MAALGKILGGTAGAFGTAALGLGGMAASVAGATPLIAAGVGMAAGAKKGAGMFGGGGAAADKLNEQGSKDSYGGLNLDILNAIYSEVATIRNLIGAQDPAAEEKEKALDADVRHREFLAALGAGGGMFTGKEKGEKKGLISWLLPALGGILVALGLQDIDKTFAKLKEYMEAIGQALANIHEFITDIDAFFNKLGVEYSGAAILGTIKGLSMLDALDKLKKRFQNFKTRWNNRFATWDKKYHKWNNALAKSWTDIKEKFKVRSTALKADWEKFKTRIGQWRIEFSERMKGYRTQFSQRMTTFRTEFDEKLKSFKETFKNRMSRMRIGFTNGLARITDAVEGRFGALNKIAGRVRGGITRIGGVLATSLDDIARSGRAAITSLTEKVTGRFGFLNRIAGRVSGGIFRISSSISTGLTNIGNSLKGVLTEVEDGVKRINGRVTSAVDNIKANGAAQVAKLTTAFESLKTRLTNLLPKKPTVKVGQNLGAMRAFRAADALSMEGVRIPGVSTKTPQYDMGERGAADSQKASKAVRAGTGSNVGRSVNQSETPRLTKRQQIMKIMANRMASYGERTGPIGPGTGTGRGSGTEMDDPAKSGRLMKWLDQHPWLKKLLKGVGKGAAIVGWLMMAYEIYKATEQWMDVKSKWDYNPMGKDDYDKVWQKEMGRIAAGYGAAMFGALAGGMVGTMVGGPVGTVVGGLGGGLAGYLAGDKMARFFLNMDDTKAEKKEPSHGVGVPEWNPNESVGSQEAALSAYGSDANGVTIIQNNVTDASNKQSSTTNTNTNVNAGGGIQNRNIGGTAGGYTNTSPFKNRF